MEKGYKLECYGDFLQAFVSDIKYRKVINTDELDEDGNEIYDSYVSVYEKSTKNKSVIESRLNQMNEMLDEYLSENCADMIDDSEEFVSESADEIENEAIAEEETFCLDEDAPEEIQSFAMEFANDKLAVQSLMLTTNCPYADFSIKTMNNTVSWYSEYGDKTMLSDCIFYKSFAITNGISEEDMNLPLYIYAVKCIVDGDEDIDVDEWLSEFKENAFVEIDSNEKNIPTANSTIALKQSEIIQNILNYNKEGVKNDEAIQ